MKRIQTSALDIHYIVIKYLKSFFCKIIMPLQNEPKSLANTILNSFVASIDTHWLGEKSVLKQYFETVKLCS